MTEIGNRFNASVEGQPQPGQWWLQTDKQDRSDAGVFRVLFVGRDSKNRLIFEDADGHVEVDHGCDWSRWHHEPKCTGWDWRPEVFPQWYVSDKWEGTAYIKRIDAENAIRVSLKGEEKNEKPWSKHGKECLEQGWYKQTTQLDAESRVTKKTVPAEDPDEWVVQDRVPYRFGTDQRRWVSTVDGHVVDYWSGKSKAPTTPPQKHGYVSAGINERLEVRCRRRDLPKEEPKLATKTLVVHEVLYSDDLDGEVFVGKCVGEERVNAVRDNWKYVSVISSKTVEVML